MKPNDNTYIEVTMRFDVPNYRERESVEAIAEDIERAVATIIGIESDYPYINVTEVMDDGKTKTRSVAFTPSIRTAVVRQVGVAADPPRRKVV